MKNKPIISRTAKSSFAIFIITLLILANINPAPVYATCIPGAGGVVTCDGADDTATGTTATTDGSTVTNTISGDGGNDVITGGDAGAVVGSDVVGNDTVVTNTLSGGDGSDSVAGGNTFGHSADVTNIIDGGTGDDTITGGSSWGGDSTADNLIIGGEGNDTIFPGGDRGTVNIIDGGNGIDTLDYSYFGAGITIDLGETAAQKTTPQLGDNGESTDTLANIENITGTTHDDTLTGTAGDNVIIGNAGDDVLAGEGGKDNISGGEGSDTIVLSGELGANNGPDQHDAGDAAVADGGSGANNIQFTANTWGNIFLVSSSGLDTLDFSTYNAPVTIDLSNNAPQLVATVSTFESIVGYSFRSIQECFRIIKLRQ